MAHLPLISLGSGRCNRLGGHLSGQRGLDCPSYTWPFHGRMLGWNLRYRDLLLLRPTLALCFRNLLPCLWQALCFVCRSSRPTSSSEVVPSSQKQTCYFIAMNTSSIVAALDGRSHVSRMPVSSLQDQPVPSVEDGHHSPSPLSLLTGHSRAGLGSFPMRCPSTPASPGSAR